LLYFVTAFPSLDTLYQLLGGTPMIMENNMLRLETFSLSKI